MNASAASRGRRIFAAMCSVALAGCMSALGVTASQDPAAPAVSLEAIAPVASDGHRGRGYLLTPAGTNKPRPGVLLLHPGNVEVADAPLRLYASQAELPRALTSAGYVVAVTTYRSRDVDPQAPEARNDSVGALNYLRDLPTVDRTKVAVFGCSNGGDLALEVGIASDVAAIVTEEPATAMFTGIMNRSSPKAGDRFVPSDGAAVLRNPKQFYTPEYQVITRAKVARIRAPVLMLQGEPTRPINGFNGTVLLPELRAANKAVTVLSYPKEPHCFVWGPMEGTVPPPGVVWQRTPATARKAIEDTLAFLSQRFAAPR